MKKLAWQQIPNTLVTDIMLSIDSIEGVVLDLEHSLWSMETIASSIRMTVLANKESYLRIHANELGTISRLLDYGANGVIIPKVENVEQVCEIMNQCTTPMYGGVRGIGLVPQNQWGKKELSAWSYSPKLIFQIETIKGIKSVVEILDTIEDSRWVNNSLLMLGPYDLSMSLGIPGDWSDVRFTDAIEFFEKNVPQEKRMVHIPDNVASVKHLYRGYNTVCVGMDTMCVSEKMKENIQAIS